MLAMIHHRLEQISRFAVWVGGAALMLGRDNGNDRRHV